MNKFALVIGSFPFSFLVCPTINPCRACSTRATSFAFLKATNSNASKRSRIFPRVVKMTFVSVLKESIVAFTSALLSFLFFCSSSVDDLDDDEEDVLFASTPFVVPIGALSFTIDPESAWTSFPILFCKFSNVVSLDSVFAFSASTPSLKSNGSSSIARSCFLPPFLLLLLLSTRRTRALQSGEFFFLKRCLCAMFEKRDESAWGVSRSFTTMMMDGCVIKISIIVIIIIIRIQIHYYILFFFALY